MTTLMNKNIYRSLLIASFILVNALILFGISSAIAYMNTGADRADMLNISTTEFIQVQIGAEGTT